MAVGLGSVCLQPDVKPARAAYRFSILPRQNCELTCRRTRSSKISAMKDFGDDLLDFITGMHLSSEGTCMGEGRDDHDSSALNSEILCTYQLNTFICMKCYISGGA